MRAAVPLGLAAMGELVVQRAGVINIGIEGILAVGALVAYVVAESFGPGVAMGAGAAVGIVVSAVFAVLVVRVRAHQVIAGTAIAMLGLGLSAAGHRLLDHSGPAVSTITAVDVPLLADLPVLGRVLFAQQWPFYVMVAGLGVVAWTLRRTTLGVVLRACGDAPAAVRGAGRSIDAVRAGAIMFGGACAGAAGAFLVVGQAGVFVEGMSAGRGFIAIAIVALGRWSVPGVAIATVIFGLASSLQFAVQALGATVPYNLVLGAPYALTLLLLPLTRGAGSSPRVLGSHGE
ncbi:MAG: ABC transporter permease [Actinobacteria bacterium]|nr:ABC transporter permease [Actinomycetota bacterium]